MKTCWCGNSIKRGNVCMTCYVNVKRFRLKKKCVAYLGNKCSRCGYNKSVQALNFHHIDEEEKEFAISGSHTRSWDSIQKELDKCILLCANCHQEEHEYRNKLKFVGKISLVSKDQQDSLLTYLNLLK